MNKGFRYVGIAIVGFAVVIAANAMSQTKISASRLYTDYRENEFAADAKYKGKFLEVRGRVHSLGRDTDGKAYLTFQVTQYKIGGVWAYFPESQAHALARVRKGTVVGLNCTGGGKLMGVLPILDGCLLLDKPI